MGPSADSETHRTPPTDLPEPRGEGAYRIAVICLGNICRSPIGQVVLTERLSDAGIDETVVRVDSGGTGGWHAGEPMHRDSAAVLREHGYDASLHRAQQVGRDWFETYDLLLAMDDSNLDDLRDLAPDTDAAERVVMFRAYDPEGGHDEIVPDPWGMPRDAFEDVLATVERTADSLVGLLVARFGAR